MTRRRTVTEPRPAAPPDLWLIARAPTDQPYPCRCTDTGCRRTCPCRGRTHTIDLPARCCARRTAETANRQSGAA